MKDVMKASAFVFTLGFGLVVRAAAVYVQPAGATGFTPMAPYDSWDTAAASLHDVESLLADEMTVHLKEGTYETTNVLTITTATTIAGAGMTKTIIQNTQKGRINTANKANSQRHVLTVNNKDAVVRDMVIMGGLRRVGTTGGGVQLDAGTLLRCCVRGNGATLTNGKGHGVYMSSSDSYVSHCVITNNSGNGAGGGIYMAAGHVDNSLVAKNRVGTNDGPGIWFAGGTLVNCTVAGNSSPTSKNNGGNLHFATTSGTIKNCLFADAVAEGCTGDGAPEWTIATGNAAQTRNYRRALTNNLDCCAFGIPSGASDIGHPGEGSFAFTAQFEDAAFRVASSSPVVGAGDVSAVASADETDLDGKPRIFKGKVDIGCYQNTNTAFMVDMAVVPTAVLAGSDVTFKALTSNEPQASEIDFVWTLATPRLAEPLVFHGREVTTNLSVVGHYDVSLAATGAESIVNADALHIGAQTNYLVVAAEGHVPSVPYDSWTTAATSVEEVFAEAVAGATILVGPGTHFVRQARTIGDNRLIGVNGAAETVLANGMGAGTGSTGHRVVALNDEKALLKGFTCRDGVGRGGMDGGGVFIDTKGGTVEDCVITNNAIAGGVYCHGAGLSCRSAKGVVRRTTITGNTARDATHDGSGGGVFLGAGRMESCLVIGNTAHAAAGVWLEGGSIENCTIVTNRTCVWGDMPGDGRFAGGLYLAGGYVINTVVAGNTSAYAPGTCPANPEVQYAEALSNRLVCCGFVAPAVAPNDTCLVADDPAEAFADPAAGNYRLPKFSTFFKRGLYSPVMKDRTDLDGRSRAFVEGHVDLGCYETEPYALALNGEPRMEVVYPANGHSVEKFAAEDLAHWVAEISGAQLPVVAATNVMRSASGLARVYIGRMFAEGLFADDLAEIGETDGFAIRRKGDDLYLFGGEPRSTVYATSRLLEENTDIIWARPAAEFGTVYTTRATIELTMTDRLEKPLFWLHGLDVAGVRRDFDTGKWALRNGANLAVQTEPKNNEGALGFVNKLSGHNFWWIVKPENDFKDHPEYFGYNAATQQREGTTLCLTADGLVDIAVEKYIERIKSAAKTAKLEAFHVGMRDTWTCCQCEKCTAPIPLPDGSTLECTSLNTETDQRYYSTRYWMFVRDVCAGIRERLKDTMPDIRYFGWGYFYGRTPPVCELPKWLYCEFCPYGGFNETPYLDEAQTPSFRESLLKWNELLPGHVWYLEYWFCESSGVPPVGGIGSVARWQRNMQDMAHVLHGPGVESFFGPDSTRAYGTMETRADWDAKPMSHWLATRLMWNPDQDLETLKRFYYTRTYREAADVMAEYTELMSHLTFDPSIKAKARTVMNSNQRRELETLLTNAYLVVQHPTAKTLIGRQLNHWEIMKKSAGSEEVPYAGFEEPCYEIGNVSWQYAYEVPEFKLPTYFTWGDAEEPTARTEVLAQHDGSNLCLRVTCEAAPPRDDDWLYLRLKPGASASNELGKVTAAYARQITPTDADVTRTDARYAAVIVVPFSRLGIDTSRFGSYPTYEFLRYDAATRERSTPKGKHINTACGTFAF